MKNSFTVTITQSPNRAHNYSNWYRFATGVVRIKLSWLSKNILYMAFNLYWNKAGLGFGIKG